MTLKKRPRKARTRRRKKTKSKARRLDGVKWKYGELVRKDVPAKWVSWSNMRANREGKLENKENGVDRSSI